MLRKMNFQFTQFAFIGLIAFALLLMPGINGTVMAQDRSVIEPSAELVPSIDMLAYALNKSDDAAAFYRVMNQLPCTPLDSADLSGKTFRAGTYCLSSADLAGQMTLDGGNDASSIFIFRIAGAFNTKGGASVALTNNAQSGNVHFVADSANLGAGTSLQGNILTKGALNVQSGTIVKGRATAVEGAVTGSPEGVTGAGTGTLQICKATTGVDGATDTRLNNRIFNFTVTGVAGTIAVPANSCSGQIDVPVGTATVTELNTGTFINQPGNFTGGFQLTAVNVISPNSTSNTVGNPNLPARTQVINVVEGGVGQQLTLQFVNRFAITGFVEICKRAATGPDGFNRAGDPDVTTPPPGTPGGAFWQFTVAGVFNADGTTLQTFTTPVGSCTPPIAVLIGAPTPTGDPLRSTVNITELARNGYFLESVTTNPDGRLNSVTFNRGINAAGNTFNNIGGGYANVTVFDGGAAGETLVNFFNRSQPAQIKVCKVAGPGIPINTTYRFTVGGPFGATADRQTGTAAPLFPSFGVVGPITVDVLAGDPATGGNCVFVPGVGGTNGAGNPNGNQAFEVGTPVFVRELGQLVNGQIVNTRPAEIVATLPLANGGTQQFPAGDIRCSRVRSSSGFVSNATAAAANPGPGFNPNPLLDPANGFLCQAGVPARRDIVEVEFADFRFAPTQLKICKIAGAGVTVGTPFTFDVTKTPVLGQGGDLFPTFTTPVTVAAGPAAQGGTCTLLDAAAMSGLLGGSFNQGSTITITERGNSTVSAITSGTSVLNNNLAGRSTTISGQFGLVAGINSVTFTNTAATGPVASTTHVAFDFDGDGKADTAVYRANNNVWYINGQSGLQSMQFGAAGDKLAPADYDGDGKTDEAVYRSGAWYIMGSRDGFTSISFGQAGDIAVPADYDGDGKADAAVFRPSNGTWYIMGSSVGFKAIQFGAAGDKPVVGDYDGDGKADVAVFRPSSGTWYIMGSSDGFKNVQFGISTDKVVPADYDGDGKTDLAVYRDGTWYIMGSTSGFKGVQFGIASDVPVAADYDGDGKADIAVYRSGVWHILNSGAAGYKSTQFGIDTDTPIASAFVQ